MEFMAKNRSRAEAAHLSVMIAISIKSKFRPSLVSRTKEDKTTFKH
jgi:hypothetical protein